MADRGRKALPSTNHLLTERWNSYTLDLHHKRLEDIQGRCDHAVPETMRLPHLKHNMKKKYMDGMRTKEIQHENALLVDKMEKIARTSARTAPSSNGGKNSEPFLYRSTMQVKPGYRLNSYQVPMIDTRNQYLEKSLNRDHRSKELSNIGHQNQEMARRLMTITSSYDMGQLDIDWQAHEKYVVLRRNPEVVRLGKTLRDPGLSASGELYHAKADDVKNTVAGAVATAAAASTEAHGNANHKETTAARLTDATASKGDAVPRSAAAPTATTAVNQSSTSTAHGNDPMDRQEEAAAEHAKEAADSKAAGAEQDAHVAGEGEAAAAQIPDAAPAATQQGADAGAADGARGDDDATDNSGTSAASPAVNDSENAEPEPVDGGSTVQVDESAAEA